MAKTTEISISRGVTMNTGQFNSVRIDVSLTCQLNDGEDFPQAYAALSDGVNGMLENEISNTDLHESIKLTHIAQLRKNR